MPRHKPRLQLALYARPRHPGTYHYALFVSPKSTKQQHANSATKHHVKNTLQNVSGELTQPWRYERLAISDVQLEQRLLVRIVIAKVTSLDALERILEAVPVYQTDDPNQAKAQLFTCLTWVRAALEDLGRQGVVAELGEWEVIQKKAVEYVERKREVGRWSAGWKGEVAVPIFDLLNGREIVE
ncbi:uncharacterized protein PAC_11042 [Phialocephala subalpina]|uniref:Uncharacterized protein n=1 Tax=Phialocephala subalpina TaxID=576137 RepID=A0A1L7X807_9HELO|nr:uncharacterized protein PAC_11042 [Phialocephala subalpina]